MARPSDKLNPITAHIIAALSPLARVVMASGNAIDKLALHNAVMASEFVARWRADTTEMSRRIAYGRALACGEIASIESADMTVILRREAFTAYSKAICALCEGFPHKALAYAQSAESIAARL